MNSERIPMQSFATNPEKEYIYFFQIYMVLMTVIALAIIEFLDL
jgi:hypothetical protein